MGASEEQVFLDDLLELEFAWEEALQFAHWLYEQGRLRRRRGQIMEMNT